MPNRPNHMPSEIDAVRAKRETRRRRPMFGAKISKGDVIMAALGITLAAVSAVFPWYIFYNQEQFGVRAMRFQGNQSATGPTNISYQPARVGQPMTIDDMPTLELDLLSTATLPGIREDSEASDLANQPFPPDTVEYNLIHVVNGRAMIQDKDGIWVVQPGSLLPDSSRVAQIKQNADGNWVIVTTFDRIIELNN
ncbi:MAG: hypothetical protein ACK4F5_06935 [Aliihoeflea sp.]